MRRIALLFGGSLVALVVLGVLSAPPPAFAGDGEQKGPRELVHVPTEELNVLLRADRQGIVLRYEEYERLLAAARARVKSLEGQPPVDGTLVAATGTLDLSNEKAALLRLSYDVEVLADGPRSVGFPLRHLAVESILIQDADGTPSGRYEELRGRARLRFESAGPRVVTVQASSAFARKGERRLLDLRLPPAAAMSVALRLPAGMEGVVIGEGAAIPLRAPADRPLETTVRPARDGRLRVAFAPASKGSDDGPPILDTRTNSLHTVADGIVHSRVIAHVDVFRTPVREITLQVPADFAVRSLEGKGVTGFRRDERRGLIVADLEKPFLGTVTLVVDGERPYQPGPGLELAHLTVPDAVRHRAEMNLRFGNDVRVRGIQAEAGRRLPASRAKGQRDLLRYALTRADARLRADIEAGDVRTDAVSTYYLNLAETGKTLIATTTYRILEGTVFALRPRMPGGYELRGLTVNGKTSGFTRDLRADGTLEIALARGVPAGGEISLAATLEQSQADWVPDGDPVQVPLAVPSAGATREEGLVGIGADAAFRVLELALRDLVPVGAADLTARGISAAGLVYGYRLDGAQPDVRFQVQRHEPMLEARLITTLIPSPRRLEVIAVVGHRIRRAGVRQLLVDVPAWAGKEEVRFDSPFVRGAAMLAGDERPDDVPAGYERWLVDLNQRVIGRHATVVRYHLDQDEEDWNLPSDRPLGVRVPLDRSERFVVVQRAQGLEVRVNTEGEDVRSVELTELPAAAPVNPLQVLKVLRLANGSEGVGLQVRKHGGAAVLDAVATEVRLETAVAREGVLRTRAWVRLFNVDRQFLKVSLPAGSELIGAVVDGAAVKALADPAGALLVPIPTARTRDQITSASLTYETRLDGEVGSEVRVAGPTFHDLEVLRTLHRVAFDPDMEIAEVSGDYGTVTRPKRQRRPPWIALILGGLTHSVSDKAAGTAVGRRVGSPDMPAGAEDEIPAQAAEVVDGEFEEDVETDNDMPYEESLGETTGIVDAPFEGPSTNATIGIGGGAGGPFRARIRQLERLLAQEEQKARRGFSSATRERLQILRREIADARRSGQGRGGRRSRPGQVRSPGGGVPPGQRDPANAPSTPDGPPPPESRPTTASPRPAKPGDSAEPPRPQAAGQPRGAADRYYHEGDLPPSLQRAGQGRRGGRRKGLLSLDVPVVLGPRVVVAQRLGAGGALVIRLSTTEAGERQYLWLTLAFVTIGLLAGIGRGVRKWSVLGGGILLVVLIALLFGKEGATLGIALADALTVLAFAWAVLWAVRRLAHRAPRPPMPAANGVTGAALLLALLCSGLATPARADEPRPPVPKVKPPKKIFVPYDPADPTTVKPSDRVFLPLKTYLELYKAAHPESDPEIVALGRMVTLVDARYRLIVARDETAVAVGRAEYRFAKRGRGTMLVAFPLGGLAVSEATLDGQPVRLLLDKGVYRVAVTEQGDHRLVLAFRAPVVKRPDGRQLVFTVPPFAGALLEIEAPSFDGHVLVGGAGRVETTYGPGPGGTDDCKARAWLGSVRRTWVHLAEKRPAELPATVRTRVESRTIHSIRDEGTETQAGITLVVLQGRAPFVDVALPAGVSVLEASGPKVVRWESLSEPSPRVRLVFNAPTGGKVKIALRTFRAAGSPEREEELPALAVLDTTGESGRTIVNADPATRMDVLAAENLFRIGLPREKGVNGIDRRGRVVGAWRFATRPTRLAVRTRRIVPRVDLDSVVSVVFGDDRVRSTLTGAVTVEARAPVGTLVFDLPGLDEVRNVTSPGMDTWWLEGQGDARRLHVRYMDVRKGRVQVSVRLTRRLGGQRDGIAVPRWALEGARHDRGRLYLYSLADVEQKVGSVAGLRSLALAGLHVPDSGIEGAGVVNVYAWDAPLVESLPVGLRDPEVEKEAVVVSLVAPGDEEHEVEHLVLFDVRRGSVDRLRLFVPDGGRGEQGASSEVVTTRDLREMRRERVTRTDADGVEVPGTLYDIRLQSPRGGVIEVSVSQTLRARAGAGADATEGAPRPVRVVRPEGVTTTHWFSLVRTFLDGQVDVEPVAGKPDEAAWEDLPFLPAGLRQNAVRRSYAARNPFTLSVLATRHKLEPQAKAVVQAAVATVVLGRDGWARIRLDYRVFNRAQQFLRLQLPDGATLFGATAAGKPVKPLAGAGKSVLLPVPKVPLGGKGYPVSLVYRARAGEDIQNGGSLQVVLPKVLDGVEVDRTVVRLYAPHGFDYDFDSSMTRTTPEDVAADLAEVAVREAQELLELAEKGTLTQRWAAVANGLALVEHARRKLQQAPGAEQKHQSLAGQLKRLGEQLGKHNKAVEKDLQAQRRQSQQVAQSQEEFASNARNIVQLDDVTNGLEDNNKANWVLNPTGNRQTKTKGAKQEYAELKQRLATSFRGRGASDRRKNLVIADAQKKKPPSGKAGGKRSDAEQTKATYDYKQVAWLNAALKKEQFRNRQLGAVDSALVNDLRAAAGLSRAGLGNNDGGRFQGPRTNTGIGQTRTLMVNGVLLDRSNYGLEAQQAGGGGGGHVGAQGLNPSSGAYLFSGQRDGDFRGRTENVFQSPVLGDRPAQGGMFYGYEAETYDQSLSTADTNSARASQPAGKVGLMGVDVALPRIGKVYYFRSLKAGSPIEIEASPRAISVGSRVVVLLLILGAVAIVGMAVRRRFAAA